MATKSEYLKWAQSVIDQYEGKISRMLGLAVPYVKVNIDREQESAGWYDATTNTIFLNPKFLTTKDPGAVVHELVHAFTDSPDTGRRVEALADYVRYKLGLTYEGQKFSKVVYKIDEMGPKGVRALAGRLAGTDGGRGTTTTATGAAGHPPGGFGAAAGATTTTGDGGFDVEAWIAASLAGAQAGQKEDDRNRRFSFLGALSEMGIALTGNLRQLVEQAVTKGYDAGTFLYYLRKTPEYLQTFPGIFRKDGTMRMTEAQYLSNVEQYQGIAAQAGIDLRPGMVAALFRNSVSPAEFAVKAPAVSRLRRDPGLWRAFQRELVQGGVAAKGDVTRRNLLRFAAGEGNASWYDLWQDTVTRNASVEAGIQVKRGAALARDYTAISQKMLEQISGKGLSEEQLSAGFQALAEHFLTTLPLSKIQGYGLSKASFKQAIFGGPRQAEVRQKMKRVLEQEEAFYEPRVTSAVTEGIAAQGRAQRPQVQ